jgi:hypothetical protein
LAGLTVLSGCFAGGKIVVASDQEILKISPDYNVEADIGKGPVEVDTNTNLSRYAFRKNGKINSYALVIYPFNLRGELNLDGSDAFAAQKKILEEESLYGEYLDKLLRAHRLLLQGQLDASERVIAGIEASFDSSYGTDVLRGSIALMRGQPRESLKYFERAKTFDAEAVTFPTKESL